MKMNYSVLGSSLLTRPAPPLIPTHSPQISSPGRLELPVRLTSSPGAELSQATVHHPSIGIHSPHVCMTSARPRPLPRQGLVHHYARPDRLAPRQPAATASQFRRDAK